MKSFLSCSRAIVKTLFTFLLITSFSTYNFSQEVKIGTQIWKQNNLNVEYFQNGDKIPKAESTEEWIKALENKQPAWCYFENDSSSAETRGKLYNWYAVNDKRGLVPKGWRIPKLDDIRELNDFYKTKYFSKDEAQQLKKSMLFIEKLKSDFKNTQNDSLFLAHHSDDFDRNKSVRKVVDVYSEYGLNYFTREETEIIEKQDMSSVSEHNELNEKVSFIKVVGQKEVEYVSMKYLLIDKKEYTDEEAMVLADSILKVIKDQNNFAEMVKLFSADPGSIDREGVYENFSRGIMVKEIEDFVFNNDVGKIGVISTDFGISIVEVLGKKTAVRPVVVKLTKKINSKSSVAIHLKDKREWKAIPVYAHSDNKFKAVPAGYRANDGQFYSGSELAMFWTQVLNEEGLVAAAYLLEDLESLEANYFEKDIGISVRCIKQ